MCLTFGVHIIRKEGVRGGKFVKLNFDIFNHILHTAMQNLAKVVDFGGADSPAFFHPIDSRAADSVFEDKSIRSLSARFERFPKRSITNHDFIIKSCHNLDNSQKYDYNRENPPKNGT